MSLHHQQQQQTQQQLLLLLHDALGPYSPGAKAWFPDDSEGWVVAVLSDLRLSDSHVRLVFEGPASKEIVFESTIASLAAAKFATLPPLKNPPMLEGIDDLSNLSYLHEPAVLHNIRLRYQQEQIYTYSGIVLIAMNPFQRLALYSSDIMREYSGKRRGELEPHLFAVAEEAYRTMIRDKKNQSIIVSGESGAGKTQSAKYIMRYFATVDNLEGGGTTIRGGSISDAGGDNLTGVSGGISEIEEAVLSTNPIMESFGNSKTTRNDNSSRFGKYIEIMFSRPNATIKRVNIVGARIRTYLLERSRLIFQPPNERNYHIFYQLCAAVPAAERKELGLGRWSEFYYLNQGGSGSIPGFDDAAEFAVTQQALSTIGISVSMQWSIFKICAALLHIGNIKITNFRDEAQINETDPALLQACSLLQISPVDFRKWIVKKQITTRSEKITSSVSYHSAIVGRDSVAKYIYTMLFDWLVKIINKNLWREDISQVDTSFIGVLDIYGFEHFKKNSFEQFCINYANEKLQQEFNQHVFKLEQEEYVNEKITWSFIDFNDNQPCIDLIEGKLGILDLLDEESRLLSGSDSSLITKLNQRFDGKHKFYVKPRFGQTSFTVKHYATDVTYEIEAFIEKNKDTVSDEQLSVLNSSAFEFFKEVLVIDAGVPEAAAPGKIVQTRKPTLGSIFKNSLVNLMTTLRTTQVHYIRCIKPNHTKTPFGFEPQLVLSQLRACGVLETIRISCAGYPSRWTFQEFSDRYYILVPSSKWTSDPRLLTNRIVEHTISDRDLYQVGTTKIFFRAGQLASLEKRRSERLRFCVVLIQKNIRRFVYREEFLRMKEASIMIQTAYRGHLARTRYQQARQEHAAVVLQSAFRRCIAQRAYAQMRDAAVLIQSVYRMRTALLQFRNLRQGFAATKLQSVLRGFIARNWYKSQVSQVTLLQSCVRRRAAARKLQSLRVESKSVGKLKERNYTLDNKVIELSQLVKAHENENKALIERITSLENQLTNWKEKFTRAERSASAAEEAAAEARSEARAAAESRDAVSRELERVVLEGARKDAAAVASQGEVAKAREEVRRLKEEVVALKAASTTATTPTVHSAITAKSLGAGVGDDLFALRKENASLREQVAKLAAATELKIAAAPPTGSQQSAAVVAHRADIPDFDDAAVVALTSAPTKLGAPQMNDLAHPPPSYASVEYRVRKDKLVDSNSVDLPYLIASLTGLVCILALRLLDTANPAFPFDDKAVEEEIIDSLITNLRIPLPSTQTVATRSEIFFPAHLIGLSMRQLLLFNLGIRTQIIMQNILRAIQQLTRRFEDDYVSAFWLSNSHELSGIVRLVKTQLEARYRAQFDGSEAQLTLAKVQADLTNIMADIHAGWIKALRRRLANMIVPAVVEDQSLPAYMSKQSNAVWSKVGKTPGGTHFRIDQLLNFLNKIAKTLRCYYTHERISAQILAELVRVIGVSAFNHLLLRKNFCTWKRGMQLQHNVRRLEDWCAAQQIPEAAAHLQHLNQAAGLLVLMKTPPTDADVIFRQCNLLNATQIKKLLSIFYATDFDSPLPQQLLTIVNSRAASQMLSMDLSGEEQVLSLDLDRTSEFEQPRWQGTSPEGIETFIPQWLSLPRIKALLAA
ncbi:Myosin type-2 heavy chain 1 [Entophlyctis luteolus]|nr:Myosin type-2 heavy chain 1 [Entophlyctis luteolus]